MKSPFPGMDPFIEGQGLWGDFHDDFIIEMKRAIQRQLPPKYVARVSDRTYLDSIDPELDVVRHSFGPDIEVQRLDKTSGIVTGTESVALADPPATQMRGQPEYEFREIFLDIYKLDPGQQLVTSVELLSPANKRRGSVGWELYERKRNIFMNGQANLVEIDLLRAGRRHSMIGRWPDGPYAVTVFRKQQAPGCDVWAGFTTRPLPKIAVPLDPPDADVVVPLQQMVETIYELSRYAVQIRYDRPIEPPLTPEELKVASEAPSLKA
ncbi:MAG TPA: DUF4058 family protein [Pirellulaceae bacterium]|jgi:hypothetical protein